MFLIESGCGREMRMKKLLIPPKRSIFVELLYSQGGKVKKEQNWTREGRFGYYFDLIDCLFEFLLEVGNEIHKDARRSLMPEIRF